MDRIERRSSDRDGYTDRERRPVNDKHADRDRNSTIKTEQERKQKKKSKRHRSPSSSSSSESSDSAARRKKRKNKRKKKDLMSMSITDRWGMRGILRDEDMYTKDGEFRSWLQEIKRQWQMKDLWGEFAEDFNTITLPHEKYYDLAAHEAKEREKAPQSHQEESIHDIRRDERDAKMRFKNNQKTMVAAQGPSKEQLMDLKRVQEERVASEKLRILGVKPKEGLGVRYERKDLRQDEEHDHLDGVFRL